MNTPPARRTWVIAVAAGIAALTLTPQGGAAPGSLAWWCVLCGPESGADAVGNVALFVPLGAALVGAGLSVTRAALLGALCTLSIETAQALGIAGREATLGDLLTNAAGAALGALITERWRVLRRPPPARAARLAGAAGALWIVVMGLSAWLVGRDDAPGPVSPRLDLLPSPTGYGWYQGRVTALSMDGRAVATRPGTGPAIVHAPVGHTARFALTIAGGDERAGPVPLLFVHDAAGHPRLVAAKRGPDAMLWARLRAASWRLRRPQLALPGGLATLREGDTSRRAHLAGGLDGPTLWLRATAAGAPGALDVPGAPGALPDRATATLRLDAARGWALVVPFARAWGPERHALDALWVGALLVPFGAWLAAWAPGTTRAARYTRASLVAAVVVALGLGAAPASLGEPTARPAAWLASGAAILVGGWTRAGRRDGRTRRER